MENLELIIDEKALEKIHRYAKIVCDEARGSRECYGFLLSPKEKNDGIVYDAILAHNQYVTSAHGEVDPSDIKETKKEYNAKGYKAIGCWQSHGHGTVFHSRTDNDNLDNLIIEAGTNCIMGEKKEDSVTLLPHNRVNLKYKEGCEMTLHFKNKYSYSGDSENITDLEKFLLFVPMEGGFDIYSKNPTGKLNLTTGFYFAIESIKQKQDNLKSVVFSLVVNTEEENYVEAGIIEWDNNQIKNINKEKNLEIKKVNVNNLIFFDDDLRKEVREKVKNDSFAKYLARKFVR